VGIQRTSLLAVDRELAANALTSDNLSAYSREYLERLGLARLYQDDPRAALEKMREGLGGPDEHERYLALAELWFAHADKTDDRGEYLAAALCAYEFLFPGATSQATSPFDVRLRFALEIYNRSITSGLAIRESKHGMEIDPTPRTILFPFGTFSLSLPEQEFRYGGYRVTRPVALGDLQIRGLRNRYRRVGIGVPVAGIVEPADGSAGDPWIPPNAKVGVTAFVRFDPPAPKLATGSVHGTLEYYDADETQTITVGSTPVPLATEPSVLLAYRLESSPLWDFEIAGFRRPDFGTDFERNKGLGFLMPYRPGHIPVVFVHGTASSPARWAEMANELQGDPRITTHYQLWFFIYNTGNPVLLSASKLRDALQTAVRTLDPQGKDPALQQMVIIGHSQGGLLTKAMVVSSGSKFWDAVSSEPFDKVAFSAETRALLQRGLFFEPLPFVKEVVFISTPHRGSYLAENWLGMLARRFASAPLTLTRASLELATLQENDARVFRGGRFKLPTSIDNMDWSNPALRTLESLPIAPGVHAHSIIPVLEPPIETGEDGVVKYSSAHIEPVDSELVILGSGHSAQGTPEAIEEVRRILYEHAGIH